MRPKIIKEVRQELGEVLAEGIYANRGNSTGLELY